MVEQIYIAIKGALYTREIMHMFRIVKEHGHE